MKNLSLEQIERAIAQADLQKQRSLLRDLPHLLKISSADFVLLKAAEPCFDFWNNTEDIIYDQL